MSGSRRNAATSNSVNLVLVPVEVPSAPNANSSLSTRAIGSTSACYYSLYSLVSAEVVVPLDERTT